MYGHPKVISGGGCLFPTNYQIDFRQVDPWMCPIAGCKKDFPQVSQLGLHFSRAHRKLLLYDELRRGFFWPIGERKTPDKDGRFRSIVVTRGYFEPDKERKRTDVRQPPEDWESYINPTAVKDIRAPNLPETAAAPVVPSPVAPPLAAPSPPRPSTASASRPSVAPAIATPRIEAATIAGSVGCPTGNSIHEAIDISSDEEDVEPSLAELQRESDSAASGPQRVEAQRVAQSSAGNDPDTEEDHFQDDPLMSNGPVEPVDNRDGSTQGPENHHVPEARSRIVDQPSRPEGSDIWTYITQFARTPTPRPSDDAITKLLTMSKRQDLPVNWQQRLHAFDTLSLHQLTSVILYLGGEAALTSPCIPMGCNLRPGAINCADPDHDKGLCRSCLFAFPRCVILPQYLFASEGIGKRLECYFCCNSYYRGMGHRLRGVIGSRYMDEIAGIKTNGTEKIQQTSDNPTSKQSNAQLASFNSSAVQKQPLPESSSAWDYIMSFSKINILVPNDEAILELLALPRIRELPLSWKYQLGAFDELDLKSYTSLILYLVGDEAVRSPCNTMGCIRNESVVQAAAELASREDDKHWNRVNVKYAFPKCVFLPRHLLSSQALGKRLGIKTCCNAYYRIDKTSDKASKEQVMVVLGRTGTDGNANQRAPRSSASAVTANSGSTNAKATNKPLSSTSGASASRSPFISSSTTAFTGLAIRNKPQATPQQRNNKASSQKSSGTFCIPEGTPGQVFLLKGTETKLIQSSRNQILRCKVLAGSGVKWQLVGCKEIKAYEGHWNGEWEIPPDSQCLIKNIHPEKSIPGNLTCVDVNPKKRVVKAGLA
ncbi:hypothetical protein B0T09DRAFT_73067 [Sordaria sp. MPI-SDFR-AT-0083]|nr:hypothetical protein B0T09DRAFT_73067 [Sordaria sp. MPI-SDFR-AT-0083]